MLMSSASEAGPKGTQSLSRAISVLRAVAGAPAQGARLSDLVEGTGLSKATAHRLAATLVHEGLLAYDAASRFYTFGEFFREVGERAGRKEAAAVGAPEAAAHPSLYQRPDYCGSAIPSPISCATATCPASAHIRP